MSRRTVAQPEPESTPAPTAPPQAISRRTVPSAQTPEAPPQSEPVPFTPPFLRQDDDAFDEYALDSSEEPLSLDIYLPLRFFEHGYRKEIAELMGFYIFLVWLVRMKRYYNVTITTAYLVEQMGWGRTKFLERRKKLIELGVMDHRKVSDPSTGRFISNAYIIHPCSSGFRQHVSRASLHTVFGDHLTPIEKMAMSVLRIPDRNCKTQMVPESASPLSPLSCTLPSLLPSSEGERDGAPGYENHTLGANQGNPTSSIPSLSDPWMREVPQVKVDQDETTAAVDGLFREFFRLQSTRFPTFVPSLSNMTAEKARKERQAILKASNLARLTVSQLHELIMWAIRDRFWGDKILSIEGLIDGRGRDVPKIFHVLQSHPTFAVKFRLGESDPIKLNESEQRTLHTLGQFISMRRESGKWVLEESRFDLKVFTNEFHEQYRNLPPTLLKILALSGGVVGFTCKWTQYYATSRFVVARPDEVEVGGDGWKRFVRWLESETGVKITQ